MTTSISTVTRCASLSSLSLAALGIVFGDIGTSPLYTFKTILALTGDGLQPSVLLGLLSLVIWTLMVITTIKYVLVAMRIDNEGEGGILALMALLGVKLKSRPIIVALGLLGAALIYGDGSVTPAISVLSAIEGLTMVHPSFAPYVLPVSLGILVGLFLIQPQGTVTIGRAFGPVMLLWFLVIALSGLWGILQHPGVLAAVNPYYALHYLLTSGWTGLLVLGGVFLCVTGAEALYADMGHFGAKPIRLAWMGLVFPSLVLNYAGQAALVLNGVPVSDNIFYRLCPDPLRMPLVLMATLATIIASQSIITGAFSMTRQAIQLGWLPPLTIKQTSPESYGQIYVGTINWLLMLVTCGLMLVFQKSDNLASAYGIAVSTTMLSTSILLYMAMRELWHWPLWRALALAGLFIIIDLTFFTANLSKIAAGGYVPLVLAGCVFGLMLIWHRGAQLVSARMEKTAMPIEPFLKQMAQRHIPRVPGTAIFVTHTTRDVPPVMVWHVSHNRALHKQLLVITVETHPNPWLPDDEPRLSIQAIAPDFWRGIAHFGFMEPPDIPALLINNVEVQRCEIDLSDVTYYLGHETIIPNPQQTPLSRLLTVIFSFMQRNALHTSDYFKLPIDKLVEIGRQITI